MCATRQEWKLCKSSLGVGESLEELGQAMCKLGGTAMHPMLQLMIHVVT